MCWSSSCWVPFSKLADGFCDSDSGSLSCRPKWIIDCTSFQSWDVQDINRTPGLQPITKAMQLLKKSRMYAFLVGWIAFAQLENVNSRWSERHFLQFYTRTQYLAPSRLECPKISISHDEGLDQKRCGQCGSIDAVLKKSSDRGKTRGPNLSHQSLPPVRGAWDISIKDGAGWFVSLSNIRRQTRQSETVSSS